MNKIDFGVVIAVCSHDFHLAKACAASVKYFMPDVSICFIADGEFDMFEVENTYSAIIIRKKDIKNEFLRENGFGWGMTRLISIWESPFEYSLVLDADTVLWGNIRDLVPNIYNFDVIADKPKYTYTKSDVNKWFFNTDIIERKFSDFNWVQYCNSFFCPGVSIMKKNTFNLEHYKEIVMIAKNEKNIFLHGDMGYWNFHLFRSKQNGLVSVDSVYLQTIMPDFTYSELRDKFYFRNNVPNVGPSNLSILHYCGNNKAYVLTPFCYSLPMTFFRKRFIKDIKGKFTFFDWLTLINEDVGYFHRFYKGKVIKKFKIFIKFINSH